MASLRSIDIRESLANVRPAYSSGECVTLGVVHKERIGLQYCVNAGRKRDSIFGDGELRGNEDPCSNCVRGSKKSCRSTKIIPQSSLVLPAVDLLSSRQSPQLGCDGLDSQLSDCLLSRAGMFDACELLIKRTPAGHFLFMF